MNNKETNQIFVYILAVTGIAFTFTALSSVATQYLAKSFNYSPNLGETWIFGFYNPLSWISWSISYQSYYPDFFKQFFMYVTAGIILSFLVFIIIKYL